jgi:hypothetical protein
VADARARRADHFSQRLLADLCQNRLGLAFLAEVRQEQQGPRKALFAGIEQLIDQIRFDATVARQEMGDKQFGKRGLRVNYADDLRFRYPGD